MKLGEAPRNPLVREAQDLYCICISSKDMGIPLLSSDSLIFFFLTVYKYSSKQIPVNMFAFATRILAIKVFLFYLVFISLDTGRTTVNVNQLHSLLSTCALLVEISEILLKEIK